MLLEGALPVQRQAMHMTLPVPEQEPHLSAPWLRTPEPAGPMSGLLPSADVRACKRDYNALMLTMKLQDMSDCNLCLC